GPAESPTILAASMAQPVFDLVGLAGLEAVPPALPRPFAVVRVEHSVPRLSVGRALRHAGDLVPALVVVVMEAIGQGRPDHVRQGVGKRIEARVALAQRVSGSDKLRLELT